MKNKFYKGTQGGESYTQIAEKLDSSTKSVDNAIQRIRKKATKSLNYSDDEV